MKKSLSFLLFLTACTTISPPSGYEDYCKRYPERQECGGTVQQKEKECVSCTVLGMPNQFGLPVLLCVPDYCEESKEKDAEEKDKG